MPTTTAYPGALDDLDADLIPGSGANADAPLGQDGAGAYTHPDHHAVMADAIEALEAKVGTGASTPTAGTVLTGTATGVASWEPALRKATVTLSSADILALNSSPKTLVAAPGAGKALMVHRVIAFLDGQTTPYTMTDNVIVQYQGASSALCGTLNGLLAETGDKFGTYAASDFLYTTAWAENTLVELFAIDGNPTDGDGTLTVTVWYSIEDVP